jgi:hypothetical protein
MVPAARGLLKRLADGITWIQVRTIELTISRYSGVIARVIWQHKIAAEVNPSGSSIISGRPI